MIDLNKNNDLQAHLAKLRREGEERAAQQLAQKIGLPYADLSKTPVSLEAVKLIPENEARGASAAAIEMAGKKVALVATNPELASVKKVASDLEAKGYEVKANVVSMSSLNTAFGFYKFIKQKAEDITGKISISKDRLEELKTKLTTFDAVQDAFGGLDFKSTTPVDIMEIALAGALALRASDIHTEAEEKNAKIRFRVDGILHDVFNNFPLHSYDTLVSRIKLLSGMKLNVSHEAQDGRFFIRLADKDVEMRVSIIPAEFGETIVMRILDPSATLVTLEQLGLREDNLVLIKRELARPNGLILNTGPTGSGKTTTLYAFLRTLNNPEIKIITLEDPIEYRLTGIEQTQVDDEAGYTFANGLRAIVRQDPDVVLVGEIRDLETADIAMQAALTGHLVLSTLHTNDAVGAVPRLINLGVKAVSVGPALALVIAQRLVRVLCAECKKATVVDEELTTNIKKFLEKLPAKVKSGVVPAKAGNQAPQALTIYAPVGCDKCNKTGYKGRVGIFEFLEGGPDLEQTILKEASEVSLHAVAEKQGMVTMQQDGILKVLEGKTTFDEVKDATGEIVW